MYGAPDRHQRFHRGGARTAHRESFGLAFGIVPIDMRVARRHAQLCSDLLTAGRLIGTHDSWIAATGIAYGHSVVTSNVDEFQRVPGLSVIPVPWESTGEGGNRRV